jgi:folylpolyglutamate synthase/dihydropteroate synthase
MARNPGRNEWLAPDLLVDCAHNADGAAQLAAYLRQLPRDRRRTLLLGVSKGQRRARDRRRARARGRSGDLYAVQPPRAADPKDLAHTLVDIERAGECLGSHRGGAAASARRRRLVIAAGSVFLAGAVRDILGAR